MHCNFVMQQRLTVVVKKIKTLAHLEREYIRKFAGEKLSTSRDRLASIGHQSMVNLRRGGYKGH